MDLDLLKYLGGTGAVGVLAGLIFMVYRKDALQWQDAWKGQSQMLVQVVKENTEAITALTEKLDGVLLRQRPR